MSINVPLARDEATSELFPLPRPNEVFVCKRENVYFQSASSTAVCKGMGLFLMSSCRLVFIAQKDKNKEDFLSFEIPLSGIRSHEFRQPIFGCNYLEVSTRSEQPEIHSCQHFPVYLYFYSGGAGVFLEIFWRLVGEVERERGRTGSTLSSDGGESSNYAGAARNLLQNASAFVDRTDPSVFYLQQPTASSVRRRNQIAPLNPSEEDS